VTQVPQLSSSVEALKCELADEVLRRFGKLRLQVTGWSMLPTIWPGDTLMVERINADGVSEGDIVLCARDRHFVAHRVVKKSDDCTIVTRGDAMLRGDSPVPHRDLLAKVSFIVRDGQFIKPDRVLRWPGRGIAVLVRRSGFLARVVVGIGSVRERCRSWEYIRSAGVSTE
jgi:signal peptidase I